MPNVQGMKPEAAKALLTLKLRKPDVARFNQLVKLAKKGKISSEERYQLDSFLRFGNFMTLLQSKARVALKRSESRPRRKSA